MGCFWAMPNADVGIFYIGIEGYTKKGVPRYGHPFFVDY